MPRRQGDPETVGHLLGRFAPRLGIDAEVTALMTDAEVWTAVVGADLASGCRPLRCNESTLVVGVSDPVAETRLRYAAGAVQECVNEYLGRDLVRSVVVRREF